MRKIVFLFIILLSVTACDGVFDIHPYDVDFDGETGINAKNIAIIEERFRDVDTLKVAFISDTHLWLRETRDMVADINKKDVDFVVHCGDLTDTGTTDEFCWTRDILSDLNVPYVALIGNHDFLGTGDEVYSEMYGEMNFSFIADSIKFVCLNTNSTEYDYMAAVPDLDFIEEQMVSDTARFRRTIVVMHAQPGSDQFNNNVSKAFERYLWFLPGLMFCVSGHDHKVSQDDLYGDGLIYYRTDCAEHRNYYIFTITEGGYEYEVVYF